LQKQQGLTNQLTDLAQTFKDQIDTSPLSFDGLTQLPSDIGAFDQNVQDALYRRNTQYLDPQFAQQQKDLETQLITQGIPRGSEAFNREMDNFARQKQAAYADARDAAISAAGNEASRQFGLAQTARNQGISELQALRTFPQNELAALLQGAPAIQSPNFAPASPVGVSPTDVIGAYGLTQAANNAAYQGGVNAASSGNSAIAGLAGAGLTAAAIF
jgi:hypothetical protein